MIRIQDLYDAVYDITWLSIARLFQNVRGFLYRTVFGKKKTNRTKQRGPSAFVVL